MTNSLERTPLMLSTFDDPVPAGVRQDEFDTMTNWAMNWLSRPNADLGRKGAVCPYTGRSIAKGLFRMAWVRGDRVDHRALVDILQRIRRVFPELSPTSGEDVILKTIVVVLPDVTDFRQIDDVQLECKNAFVKSGLMVGQFYPGHTEPGLWNPAFRPLDAPYAMLAVRNMVPGDFAFLRYNQVWMRAYLQHVRPDIPAGVRVFLRYNQAWMQAYLEHFRPARSDIPRVSD